MSKRHDRRMTYLSFALAIILGIFIRLMMGELHDDIGPAAVPTIIIRDHPTVTPPLQVYAAEVKR